MGGAGIFIALFAVFAVLVQAQSFRDVHVQLAISAGSKCPLANDSSVTALRSQIAQTYRVASRQVDIVPSCAGDNARTLRVRITTGVESENFAVVNIMRVFASDVNDGVFINNLISSASLVEPTTPPPKDGNVSNWKIAIGVVVAYLGFLFVAILVLVLMNLKVLRQN